MCPAVSTRNACQHIADHPNTPCHTTQAGQFAEEAGHSQCEICRCAPSSNHWKCHPSCRAGAVKQASLLITAFSVHRPGMYRDHTALESAECLRGIGSPCEVAEACVACGLDNRPEVCPWEGMAAPSFCNPDPDKSWAEPVPLQLDEDGEVTGKVRCQCKSRYYGYSSDPATTRVANLTNMETLTKLICARCPRGGASSAPANGTLLASRRSVYGCIVVIDSLRASVPCVVLTHSKLQPRWQ